MKSYYIQRYLHKRNKINSVFPCFTLVLISDTVFAKCMSFVNFDNKILLCAGRSKTFLTRNELIYDSKMFLKTIQKKKKLIEH